ncbi:MAG: MazG nucleotide pyrophosphohydrolase domain-containing protein [Candidatus Asgardarchaeia archaeon]
MEISEAQSMMFRIYFTRDSKRGLEKTYMWFVEEVGELARSLLKAEKSSIKEELADVFAWLLSIANLLEIDLEKAFLEKYPNRCPRCGKNPCVCP